MIPETRTVDPDWLRAQQSEAFVIVQLALDLARKAAHLRADPLQLDQVISVARNSQALVKAADGFAELTKIIDGTHPAIVTPKDPSTDPDDLATVVQNYKIGQFDGDDVIVEKVWDYGTGPDALPDAIEAVSKKLRELPPERRNTAEVFLHLTKDTLPTGTVPGDVGEAFE